jgi:hypothetical protein
LRKLNAGWLNRRTLVFVHLGGPRIDRPAHRVPHLRLTPFNASTWDWAALAFTLERGDADLLEQSAPEAEANGRRALLARIIAAGDALEATASEQIARGQRAGTLRDDLPEQATGMVSWAFIAALSDLAERKAVYAEARLALTPSDLAAAGMSLIWGGLLTPDVAASADGGGEWPVISLGAFAENFVRALAAHGLETTVTLDDDALPVAVAHSGSAHAAAPADLAAMATRHAEKRPMNGAALTVDDWERLARPGALGRSGAGVELAWWPRGTSEFDHLARETKEAFEAQAGDPAARSELAGWLRFSDAETRERRDGLPAEQLALTGWTKTLYYLTTSRQSATGDKFAGQSVAKNNAQVNGCGAWAGGRRVRPEQRDQAGHRSLRDGGITAADQARGAACLPMPNQKRPRDPQSRRREQERAADAGRPRPAGRVVPNRPACLDRRDETHRRLGPAAAAARSARSPGQVPPSGSPRPPTGGVGDPSALVSH